MAILRILFRRGSPRRLRLMAFANVMACSFVVIMTLMTSAIGYFAIVPGISSPRWASIHRTLILYLFVNVCGNFLLCVFVDTSTSRARSSRSSQRRAAPSPRTSRSSPKRSSSSQEASSAQVNDAEVPDRGGHTSPDPSSRTCEVFSSVKPGSGSTLSKDESNPPSGKDSVESGKGVAGNSSELLDNDRAEEICCRETKYSGEVRTGAAKHSKEDGECKVSEMSLTETKTDSAWCHNNNNSISVTLGSGRTEASPRTGDPKASPAGSGASPKTEALRNDQPERSHECKLCEKQILRRDHHCFFMTVCVGFHNHKHFIFFCLYMMIGALYGVLLTVRYLYVFYKVRFWGPQTFFFLLAEVFTNILSKGKVPTPFFAVLIYQLYVCLAVGLFAAGFLYWHVAITCSGQTTYEATAGDRRYSRGLASNLREVLGKYWPLLFLLPLPLPQWGDGWSYPAAARRTRTKPEAGSSRTKDTSASGKKRNSEETSAVNGVGGSSAAGTGDRVRERRVGSGKGRSRKN